MRQKFLLHRTEIRPHNSRTLDYKPYNFRQTELYEQPNGVYFLSWFIVQLSLPIDRDLKRSKRHLLPRFIFARNRLGCTKIQSNRNGPHIQCSPFLLFHAIFSPDPSEADDCFCITYSHSRYPIDFPSFIPALNPSEYP